MYVIQNIKTSEFVCHTDLGCSPNSYQQRTSLKQLLNFDSLRWAKLEFLCRQCRNDYRIVSTKMPEVCAMERGPDTYAHGGIFA